MPCISTTEDSLCGEGFESLEGGFILLSLDDKLSVLKMLISQTTLVYVDAAVVDGVFFRPKQSTPVCEHSIERGAPQYTQADSDQHCQRKVQTRRRIPEDAIW